MALVKHPSGVYVRMFAETVDNGGETEREPAVIHEAECPEGKGRGRHQPTGTSAIPPDMFCHCCGVLRMSPAVSVFRCRLTPTIPQGLDLQPRWTTLQSPCSEASSFMDGAAAGFSGF